MIIKIKVLSLNVIALKLKGGYSYLGYWVFDIKSLIWNITAQCSYFSVIQSRNYKIPPPEKMNKVHKKADICLAQMSAAYTYTHTSFTHRNTHASTYRAILYKKNKRKIVPVNRIWIRLVNFFLPVLCVPSSSSKKELIRQPLCCWISDFWKNVPPTCPSPPPLLPPFRTPSRETCCCTFRFALKVFVIYVNLRLY